MLEVKDLKAAVGPVVSFAVDAGETLALRGSSGVGKSLILRAIADLDSHEGEVLLEGQAQASVTAAVWPVRWVMSRPNPVGGPTPSPNTSPTWPPPNPCWMPSVWAVNAARSVSRGFRAVNASAWGWSARFVMRQKFFCSTSRPRRSMPLCMSKLCWSSGGSLSWLWPGSPMMKSRAGGRRVACLGQGGVHTEGFA